MEKCCEDVHGNSLCRRQIGTFCNIKQVAGGDFIRLTRDGVALMREIGCPYFLQREARVVERTQLSRCESCEKFDGCLFKAVMGDNPCKLFTPRSGVLSKENWT
jgi:hypothetical protein